MLPSKILILQTAFLGDVILATALVEKLHLFYPNSQIDFVLRKGNESLLVGNPIITKLYIWNKQENKINNLYQILQEIRNEKYDIVINLQRFFSSGILAGFSGAKKIIGFANNPLSFLFHEKYIHQIGNNTHEIARNQALIANFTDNIPLKPKLYPSIAQENKVKIYQTQSYICVAPSSVWFTKQYPLEKWADLLAKLPEKFKIYILGSPTDSNLCEEVRRKTALLLPYPITDRIENLCGKLTLLESAALMRKAVMNYVNDSAPLHLASAVNAPVCAIFCSTIPEFGFTPLSDVHFVVQTKENLACRPCGLHGYKQCPKAHFLCGNSIATENLLAILPIQQ
jgi:heptosyltransferase-2